MPEGDGIFMNEPKSESGVLSIRLVLRPLSQGLRANGASTFFGALVAVPLTVHLYRRIWPSPRVGGEHAAVARISGSMRS